MQVATESPAILLARGNQARAGALQRRVQAHRVCGQSDLACEIVEEVAVGRAEGVVGRACSQ